MVIIGSGLAAYMLAQEWRKLDQRSPLTIITAEQGHYYYKPALTNALANAQGALTPPVQDVAQMAERLQAQILSQTTIDTILPDQRQIQFGEHSLNYDSLVIACGARVIEPDMTGDTSAIFHLNTLADYEALKSALASKREIVILGAGFVGSELANTLVNLGYSVKVVAPSAYPLASCLPEVVGRHLAKALADRGVQWFWHTKAVHVERISSRYEVSLADGKQLGADLVLSTIGLRPVTGLAEAAGLQVRRGIVVNRLLATSAPSIYALGDCAEVGGLTLQFVAPLLQCARALAKTLAGTETEVSYPVMPIILKTPAYPTVLSPPPIGCEGQWQIQSEDTHIRALFYDNDQRLRGFVLTGAAVKERMNISEDTLPLVFS